MAETAIAQRVRVIDTDSHVSEPDDLWTSRLPKKFQEGAPHVEFDAEIGENRWVVGEKWLSPVGYYAMAGWDAPVPQHPLTLDEGDHGSYDPRVRLERMDQYGIYAQVLYPNVIAFNQGAFMLLDRELGLACTQAYNDFLSEFAATDPKRYIPLTVLPFWDIDETIKEMERCRANGHKGILWTATFEHAGLPSCVSTHWDRVYAACQDMDLSVNFHAGFSAATDLERDGVLMSRTKGAAVRNSRKRAEQTGAGLMPDMAKTIALLVTSDLCERFPQVKLVAVESGFGYIPYLIESLDWHFKSYGVRRDFPTANLPSDNYKRQVYGTFWFEKDTLQMLDGYQDNMMFETDYPHPTSLSPGPYSPAEVPSVHIDRIFEGIKPEIVQKVLHDNAAKLYHLDA